MAAPVVRVGDISNHGGTVISGASTTTVNNIAVAVVGSLHSCPLKGHGVTPIGNGSTTVKIESNFVALVGISTAGCGAVIITGSPNTTGS